MDSATKTSVMELPVTDIQAEIPWVTLSHMGLDIDPASFLIGKHDNTGRDMAIYLVQQYYKGYIVRLGADVREFQLKRALVESKKAALNQATFHLPDTVDQCTQFLLADAEETKWYRHFEWDGIQEMLMHMFDGYEENSSSYRDMKFFAETVFPAARQAGVKKNDLIKSTTQIKKMRTSVAALRETIEQEKNGKVTKSSADRVIRTILKMVADNKVTYRKFYSRMDRFRGKQAKVKKAVPGKIYIIPEGLRIVIDVPDERTLKFIERGMRGRVDLSLGNLSEYIDQVTNMLKLRTLQDIIELREMEDTNDLSIEYIASVLNGLSE